MFMGWGFLQDVMFELSKEEVEQGVAMLSGVLNSERTIQVNMQIMRAFTQLRQMLSTHKERTGHFPNIAAHTQAMPLEPGLNKPHEKSTPFRLGFGRQGAVEFRTHIDPKPDSRPRGSRKTAWQAFRYRLRSVSAGLPQARVITEEKAFSLLINTSHHVTSPSPAVLMG